MMFGDPLLVMKYMLSASQLQHAASAERCFLSDGCQSAISASIYQCVLSSRPGHATAIGKSHARWNLAFRAASPNRALVVPTCCTRDGFVLHAESM